MSIHQISFLPIARADVPLVSQWLATPHVARWWADDASPDAIEADYGACIDGTKPCEVFAVHFDNKPMGLIQRYRFDAYPQYTDELAHMLAVPDIAFSIDYFIGPESALQRGWGSAMILAFVDKLWQDDPMASCLIVPIQAGNRASWRALIIFAQHVEAKRYIEIFNRRNSMNYVDAFVSPVPLAKKEAYLAMARVSTPIFKEFGALRVVECWGDDVPPGKLTSLPMAVKCESDEVVVFSWIEWPSKLVRDDGMKRFMADKRLEGLEMPYDGKRVIFGGFEVIMDA